MIKDQILAVSCGKVRTVLQIIARASKNSHFHRARFNFRDRMSRVTWVTVRFSQGHDSEFLLLLGHFARRGTEPVSAPTLKLLYCFALHNFSLANFVSGHLTLTEF